MLDAIKEQAKRTTPRPGSVLCAGLVAAALVSAVPSALADVEVGRQALEQGDYAAALEQFDSDARAGDLQSRYYLGKMYLEGLGVEADRAQALGWFYCAAEGGAAEGGAVAEAQSLIDDLLGSLSAEDVERARQSAAACQSTQDQSQEPGSQEPGSKEKLTRTLESFWGKWTVVQGEADDRGKRPDTPEIDPLSYEPKRYDGLLAIFFAPAKATLEVAKEGALAVGANRAANSFYSVKVEGNKVVLGLLALFWWFILFRVLLFLKEQMFDHAAENLDAGPEHKKWDRLLLGEKDDQRSKRF